VNNPKKIMRRSCRDPSPDTSPHTLPFTSSLIPQFTLLQKIAPRMYQNAPFSVQKSKNFSGEVTIYPYLIPCAVDVNSKVSNGGS